MYIYIYIYTELSAIAHTRGDSFKLGLMSLADQSPCTSWLAQYERTEACRAALALNVSGWPASRSAVAPRLTPSIKQIAQQSRVSLRTRDDIPRPVAFGLARPPRARGDGGLCTVTNPGEISCSIRACQWTQKATAGGVGKVQAQKKAKARQKEKKPPLLFKHNFRKLVLHSRAKEPAIFC